MIKYKDMIANARKNGLATEQAMWTSITAVDDLLDDIDDEELKFKFLRGRHEELYGPHYDEQFAEHDVSSIKWHGKDGATHSGAHWTKDQVKSAMSGKTLPQGTTSCDLWVAANVMYSDMQSDFDDDAIIRATHSFFFSDMDAPEGKVWKYMSVMRN